MSAEHDDFSTGESLLLEARRDLPYKEAKRRLLEEFECVYIRDLLDRHGGNVSAASRESGLSRKHVHTLIAKYGLIVNREPQS